MKPLRALVLAALLLGCGAANDDEIASKSALDIYEVSWNLTEAKLEPVLSLADLGDTIVFFGAESAVLMVGGEVQGDSGAGGPFRAAAAIPAADGVGQWIVGVTEKGRLLRVHLHDASTEDVSARYGLEDIEVRGLAALGRSEGVAFLLPDGVAIADGVRVRHFKLGAATALAGTDKKLAVVTGDAVQVMDVASGALAKFAVASARAAAFGHDGRLFVAAGRTVYREDEGRLAELHRASADVYSLVTAGKRVWFGAGAELGVIHEGQVLVRGGLGAGVSALVPSDSGDVWAIAAGAVKRFAAAGGDSGAAQTWTAEIKPIFDRSCAACHLPGGLAGIDLSTYDTWNVTRSNLMRRVVVERTMPPQSSKALSDPDRQKILAWLTGHLDE